MVAFNEYLMCQELHVLPEAGGLRNQPHETILYFEIFRAASAEVQSAEVAKSRGK
jgi:hypothetical protein